MDLRETAVEEHKSLRAAAIAAHEAIMADARRQQEERLILETDRLRLAMVDYLNYLWPSGAFDSSQVVVWRNQGQPCADKEVDGILFRVDTRSNGSELRFVACQRCQKCWRVYDYSPHIDSLAALGEWLTTHPDVPQRQCARCSPPPDGAFA